MALNQVTRLRKEVILHLRAEFRTTVTFRDNFKLP